MNADSKLLTSSTCGSLEIAKTSLGQGANVNARGYRGRTALMIASECGHFEIVTMLLNHGADVNLQSEDNGWTALVFASLFGHLDIVKELLNRMDIIDKSFLNYLNEGSDKKEIEDYMAIRSGIYVKG